MMRHGWALLVSLVLLSCAVGFGQAQAASSPSGGAMLYANGNAKVNGQPAGISTSIFAGDRVDVGDASAVSINRAGSSIVLSPNSSVQYDPTNLDVLKGTVRVSTNQGMAVHVRGVSIAPVDKSAKFDVIASASNVNIASQMGALTVTDNGRSVALSAGSNTTVAAAVAGAQQTTVAQTTFLNERLADHPFYGVVNGVSTVPTPLPVCPNISTCLRPNTSQIHPCCCPPLVMCGQ